MTTAHKWPELYDPEWMHEHYTERKMTMYDIADLLGCSDGTVYYAMRKIGLQARPNTQRLAKFKRKRCRTCGETFQPEATCHLYCSDRCQPQTARNWHICTHCGTEFEARVVKWHHYKKKFCSAEHRQQFLQEDPSRPRWTVTSEGYIHVRVGVGYPGALPTGYMAEHRWVMEQRLGRNLLPHEEVHHRNTHRDDNDRCANCQRNVAPPEVRNGRLHCAICDWESRSQPNLELWSGSQPRGGRVDDKIEWALGFLAQYGDVRFQPFLPAGSA